jgi:ABC-type nitrate/sulfonate/bicarbonate transport system permease component
LVSLNRHVSRFLSPIITFFQAVAGPTWIPLAVLWFGLGTASVAFIVFNSVFFLVFYGTLVGVSTINTNFIASVRTLGARRRDVVLDVLLPGCMPGLLNGLRVGVAYGWRSLIAGEIIATGNGLGVFVWNGLTYFRVTDIFIGLILIGVISLAMERVVIRRLELATIVRWGMARHAN